MLLVNFAISLLFAVLALADNAVNTHQLVPMNLCVRMCVDINYGGACKNVCGSPGMCYPLNAPLAGQLSSLKLNKDVSSCSVFASENCQSGNRDDHITNLQGEVPWIGSQMNDRVRSYYCY